MTKTTSFMLALILVFSLFGYTQTTVTTTKTVDVSGFNSWDQLDDANNENIIVTLDGLTNTTPCQNPVLEVIGIGWDVNVRTIGDSWLSEMRMAFDTNQDNLRDYFLILSTEDNNNGGNASTAYSSGGILDLGLLPVANATSGDVTIQLFEQFDDVADAIDGVWESGSMTIEYRLTCESALSLDDKTNELFSVFPNPATDVLNIKSTLTIDSVVIHNLLGKNVGAFTGEELINNTIDISKYQQGMYFVSVTSGEKSETFKITKN